MIMEVYFGFRMGFIRHAVLCATRHISLKHEDIINYEYSLIATDENGDFKIKSIHSLLIVLR